MNRPFTRSANNFFRPALDLLNKNNSSSRTDKTRDRARAAAHTSASGKHNHKSSAGSLDDIDYSDREQYAQMESNTRASHSTQNSLTELQPPMQLIDVGSASGSRAPSPYPRARSAVQSEDEDDFEPVDSIRPLVSHDVGSGGRRGWKGLWKQDGLGAFFFGTWLGWQMWVGLLVFWVGGCGFGLMLMNRFILLTGVYKFPYPLTSTYLQLLLTHILLVGFSSLTRVLGGPLRRLGFGAAIAPAYPTAPQGGAFRQSHKKPSIAQFARWLANGQGGIAGGGLFELNTKVVKQVLPLAVVFVLKVLLSTISFAYAPLSVYQLARIGVTPAAVIFTCIFQKENHSASTLSSALIATLNLLFASIRSNVRVTWEAIVAGVFSSLFTALFPILLLRTYRTLLSGLIPQGDVLTGYPSTSSDETSNREETRAYYRTLHYTSLLSLLILTPIVVLSGEVPYILRNIPFLDVPFFWFMVWCGAIGSWAVFTSTLLLVKATSPLTATFLCVPRGAFQLMAVSMFKMPTHSWVGVALCWVSSLWFLVARRDEGRVLDRLKLEGR